MVQFITKSLIVCVLPTFAVATGVPSAASTQTPREKARLLATQTIADMKPRKAAALEEQDLALWLQAEKQLLSAQDPMSFEWIYSYDGYQDYSLEQYLGEALGPEMTAQMAREAHLAVRMWKTLLTQTPTQDEVSFTLARYRETSIARTWSYRVMVLFPRNAKFRYFRGVPPDTVTYFSVCNQCVNHSADDLYKKLGGADKATTIPLADLGNVIAGFWEDPQNQSTGHHIEFCDPLLGKRDPFTYLFAAVTGQFSNERRRFDIPLTLISSASAAP